MDIVSEPLTSLIFVPKRGSYGKSTFPGNCSGVPIKIMLEYFKPKFVLDPMEGSGTCRDVCRELNIQYEGFDIITGDDILDSNFCFDKKYDFIHWHPPYFGMKRKEYLELCSNSNNMGIVKNVDEYVNMLLFAYDKLFLSLVSSGIMAVLCGLTKVKGKIFDMGYELKKHDEQHYFFEIIKAQCGIDKKVLSNDWSKKYHVTRKYTLFGNPYIPIMHEKYILFKKDGIKK
jgi:hypothetical protein